MLFLTDCPESPVSTAWADDSKRRARPDSWRLVATLCGAGVYNHTCLPGRHCTIGRRSRLGCGSAGLLSGLCPPGRITEGRSMPLDEGLEAEGWAAGGLRRGR